MMLAKDHVFVDTKGQNHGTFCTLATVAKLNTVNINNLISQKVKNFGVAIEICFFPKNLLAKLPELSQPAITCSNLTIQKLEEGVKYVQS